MCFLTVVGVGGGLRTEINASSMLQEVDFLSEATAKRQAEQTGKTTPCNHSLLSFVCTDPRSNHQRSCFEQTDSIQP